MKALRFMLVGLVLTAIPARAQTDDAPPYETQLLRLSEVLGSLHFLRRLCNASEGPVWRNAMGALLTAETPSKERSDRMTARFNRGFGAFSRTYSTCTPAAVRATELYQAEGTRLTSQIVSRYAR